MKEKRERYHRMSWIDWLILPALLLLIFVGWKYWLSRRSASIPNLDMTYTVLVSGVDDRIALTNGGWKDLIPVGARITSENGTAELGRVTALEIKPHMVATVSDGRIEFIPSLGFSDLEITVRAKATRRNGDGLRVQDIRIAAGVSGDFRVGGFLASHACIVHVSLEADA